MIFLLLHTFQTIKYSLCKACLFLSYYVCHKCWNVLVLSWYGLSHFVIRFVHSQMAKIIVMMVKYCECYKYNRSKMSCIFMSQHLWGHCPWNLSFKISTWPVYMILSNRFLMLIYRRTKFNTCDTWKLYFSYITTS